MKPARLAVCQTKSDRSTVRLRMARACLVDRNMCGWTITARTSGGTGICFTRGWSMPTVSTSPPNSEGEILSTCSEPLATASPCIANCNSSSLLHGLGNNALAATTAPTAEAAEPPRPEPSGMPLSISIAKPNGGRSLSYIASSARPAVFFSGSCGSLSAMPLMAEMMTPGSLRRATVTRSPRASTAKPRMSKPMATLPTDAGANAVARSSPASGALTSGLPDTRRDATDRRTRRRR